MVSDGQLSAFDFPWHQVRRPVVQVIRATLTQKYAPASANRMLCSLKGVLKEAWRLDMIDTDSYSKAVDIKPVKGSRESKGRALPLTEIKALMQVCTDDQTNRGVRDAAMLSILMAGLRRSEVVGLDASDIELSSGAIKVRAGKGNKDRTCYLPADLLASVEYWLIVRRRAGHEDGALFLAVSKSDRILSRRLSDQAVQTIFDKRGQEAGVEKFTPHDARRTMVSRLLDAGVDVEAIQKLAGHSNVQTTLSYSRRGEEIKKTAVEHLSL